MIQKNENLNDVVEFASNKHEHPGESQRYGTAPYSVHLDAVASNVIKYKRYLTVSQYDILIKAAYCHDLIEDTDVDINVLKEKTDGDVAELVFLVSNERGRTRKEKNFKTYPKIWNNDLAIFLKLCDRIANTRSSKDTGYRMYKVYCDEYPVFRYALKKKDQYTDMWNELDELCAYCPTVLCKDELKNIIIKHIYSIDKASGEKLIDVVSDAASEIIEMFKQKKLL